MRIVLLVSLIFSSISAWASCQVSNGKNLVTIAESQSVSLFDNGKSLSTHKTQDQDGLGTCYANSTSAVLKTVLAGHPDISYTNAALASSTLGWEAVPNGKFVKNEGSKQLDFTSGGFMCETIAAMKKMGGACAKKYSLLENRQLLDVNTQEAFMVRLGKYFDGVNEIKKDPVKFENFKKDLAYTVDSLRLENDKMMEQCLESKSVKLPTRSALKTYFMNEALNYLEKDDSCSQSKLSQIKKFLGEKTVINSDRISIDVSRDSYLKLSSFLEKDELLLKEITDYFNKEVEGFSKEDALPKLMTKKMNEFLDQEFSQDDKNGCSPLRFDDENSSSMFFISDMRSDKKETCENVLKLEVGDQLGNLLDKKQCIDPVSVDLITGALSPLLDLGVQLDQALVSDLSNTMSKNGNQLLQILNPECLDKENLIPMDKVSCSSFSTCDQSGFIDMTNSVYSGPAGGCYDIGSAKAIVKMQTFNAISSGRALGISVCTAFMENPNVKTSFCRNAAPGVEGHSFHSMAISGYRCQNGKIEYEILNSWGSYCPVSDGSSKNSAIECSLDAKGIPTGRFWIKEDVLVDSTTDINSVTLRK